MGALLPAPQKNHHGRGRSSKVDSVAGAIRDTKLKDSSADTLAIAEVSGFEPIDPSPYGSSCFNVLQTQHPVEKEALSTPRFVYDYRLMLYIIVALKLRGVKVIKITRGIAVVSATVAQGRSQIVTDIEWSSAVI